MSGDNSAIEAMLEMHMAADKEAFEDIRQTQKEILVALGEINKVLPGLIEVRGWVIWGILSIVSAVGLALLTIVLKT